MASIDDIKQYLIAMSEFNKRQHADKKNVYSCYEELVLERGRGFEYNSYPDNLEIGVSGHCHYNCLELLNIYPEFIYCEGYGFPKRIGIGLSHAWLIDKNNKIVDPTPSWHEPETVYYGIAFNYDWILNLYIERQKKFGKYYLSVLQGNYLENNSLLKYDIPKEALFNY